MSSNDNIINKLLDSAEGNIKNIHDTAISQLKTKYQNLKTDNKEKIESNLSNIINYHNNLLELLRRKYSPKSKEESKKLPFTFATLTPAQKKQLQAPPLKFADLSKEEKKDLQAPPLKFADLTKEEKKALRAPPLKFSDLTKEEKKALMGPPGEPLNGLMIDTDNVRVRTKNLNPMIEKTKDGLNLYRGFDKKTDSQIILGKDLLLKNNNNNVFLANGDEVVIGNGKKLTLNGKLDKLKTTSIESDEIKLGDSKKIYLSSDSDNNYISSKDSVSELHATPKAGWKFIKNNKGRRTEVVNIKNNGDEVPETTFTSDVNVTGKTNVNDLSSSKYNLKDNSKLKKGKEMKGSMELKNGNLSLESSKGLEISDSENKVKFLGMTFDNNKGYLNILNSIFSMNDIFKVKTDSDVIHLQNKYDENIYDIPIVRDTKFKASDIKTSSVFPGAPMYNCLQGHTKSICSTSKKNGTREFVSLKLPVRKVIAHIDIYNRIDAFMDKIKDVEIVVTDNGSETFRMKLGSVSDYYHISVNAFGTLITLQQTVPNKEINLRNVRVFTRNII